LPTRRNTNFAKILREERVGIKLARLAPGLNLPDVMRCLLAAVILFSLAPGLRAETYQEWEQLTVDAKPIPFKGWLPPDTDGTTIDGKSYSTFSAPLGHLFGHLDFSSYPPNDFPLRLRVLYYGIDPSAVNPTPNGVNERSVAWTSPLHYVSPDAGPTDLVESRESDIASPAEAGAVPVWSIWNYSPGNQYGNGEPYAVLVEVASHDGTLLARKRLIEAVDGAQTRNTSLAKSGSDGETQMKSFTDYKAVDVLPLEERVYEDVRILWLDDATLHDPAYTDSFWRGVFFAGTTVCGLAPEVQELAQRLGIAPNQRVLRGGLWSVGHSIDDLARQVNNDGGSQYVLHIKAGENPFANKVVLGRRRIHQLRDFSIWFLVIFTVFEIAIILSSLYLLHGRRRVFRWLLIPISAIVYTALGMVVVHLVVDFRPEVEIFREVDSVEGWPESFVSTDITRLGFDDGRTTFNAPAGAEYRWAGIDGGSSPLVSMPVEQQMNFSLRQRYARFAKSSVQYMATSESPCQLSAPGQLVATRALAGAWLWDGKVWRDLGPMQPGKPVDIASATVTVDPAKLSKDHSDGAPYQDDDSPFPTVQNSFPEIVRMLCSTSYMDSLKGTNTALLIAIDPRPIPEQIDGAAGSEIQTQTLLVHQFQLPAPAPTPAPATKP
jgi:hypothetical protein